jgi:hypothetical protein
MMMMHACLVIGLRYRTDAVFLGEVGFTFLCVLFMFFAV